MPILAYVSREGKDSGRWGDKQRVLTLPSLINICSSNSVTTFMVNKRKHCNGYRRHSTEKGYISNLCWFLRVTVTKCHRVADFSDRASPGSGGWKSDPHASSESLGTALPFLALRLLAALGLQPPHSALCLPRYMTLCCLASYWGSLPPLWKPVIMDYAPAPVSPAMMCFPSNAIFRQTWGSCDEEDVAFGGSPSLEGQGQQSSRRGS